MSVTAEALGMSSKELGLPKVEVLLFRLIKCKHVRCRKFFK